jgi:hypothetical protein
LLKTIGLTYIWSVSSGLSHKAVIVSIEEEEKRRRGEEEKRRS